MGYLMRVQHISQISQSKHFIVDQRRLDKEFFCEFKVWSVIYPARAYYNYDPKNPFLNIVYIKWKEA